MAECWRGGGRCLVAAALAFVLFFLPSSTLSQQVEHDWELIGSRTYEWKGDETLRCRKWDKVAIRWMMKSCSRGEGRRECSRDTNAEMAEKAEESGELPVWHNAFTFVQLAASNSSKQVEELRLGVDSERPVRVSGVAPLKVDIDWKWTIDARHCNSFSIRMSAMSTMEAHRLAELQTFCEHFDSDGFVNCRNL